MHRGGPSRYLGLTDKPPHGVDAAARVTSSRRLAYVAGGCIFATAIAAGTAFGIGRATAEGPPDGIPVQLAPARGTLTVPTGTPAEVVNALAQRLPLVRSASVSTKAIPGEEAGTSTEGLVLEYELRVRAMESSAIPEALWQGNLLVGAVADAFASRGFGAISEARASLVTPQGEVRGTSAGIGLVVRDQVFADFPADVKSSIEKVAPLFGLRDIRVSYVEGLQRAIVITATTDHPKRDVTHLVYRRGLDRLLGRRSTDFEGAYLEVRDSAGATVFAAGRASRNGAGLSWAKPELGVETGFRQVQPPS